MHTEEIPENCIHVNLSENYQRVYILANQFTLSVFVIRNFEVAERKFFWVFRWKLPVDNETLSNKKTLICKIQLVTIPTTNYTSLNGWIHWIPIFPPISYRLEGPPLIWKSSELLNQTEILVTERTWTPAHHGRIFAKMRIVRLAPIRWLSAFTSIVRPSFACHFRFAFFPVGRGASRWTRRWAQSKRKIPQQASTFRNKHTGVWKGQN